jgi:aspartate ammonia-lyase
MSVNEVIANQALQNLGKQPGEYSIISPLDDINRHQSTNDTVPTAVKIAALFSLEKLEDGVVQIQESLQDAEQRFARIVKVGRTQYQDAVLTTLGRSFGAFADLINRDRWRLSKCRERLRTVNIGGTAIGSGLAAKRDYIFSVIENLREITGLPLNRAENLVDATQNLDAFAEVSGIIRTLATSLIKICGDLRLMSSGPAAGLAEIRLPAVQAGSSIMPGKVNPVIPEAVQQAAMQYLGRDSVIAGSVSSGSLELNPFLPVIAENLLRGMDELRTGVILLAEKCIGGITANEENCSRQAENSTATITALVEIIGYERAQQLQEFARAQGLTLRQAAVESDLLSEEEFSIAVSPEHVLKLGGE